MFCEGQAYVSLSSNIIKFYKSAFKTNMDVVDLLNYAEKYKTMKNYSSEKDTKSKYDTINNNLVNK